MMRRKLRSMSNRGMTNYVRGIFSTIELWFVVIVGQTPDHKEYMGMSRPRVK